MAEIDRLVPKRSQNATEFAKKCRIAHNIWCMTKINWLEARLMYCADSQLSYDLLAKRYKVAKSTITRRAKREGWPQIRQEFQDEKLKRLLKKNINHQSEVEERHLATIRLAIKVAHNSIVEAGNKAAMGTHTAKDLRIIDAASSALYKNIMLERTILRLPTKPVRLSDSDQIEEHLIMMGLKESPADIHYRETKEALKTLDRMIERRQMLQRMIDDVDKRGAY